MQKFLVTAADGWVQVATGTICRIQVLMGWHPGMLHIYVGTAAPTDDSPYFELEQGIPFVKSSATGNVWVRAPFSDVNCNPSIVTVSDAVDSAGGGGSSGGGDASAANQALMITALTGIITELQAKADVTETQPVSLTGVSTAARQDTVIAVLSNLLTALEAKATLSETQPVSVDGVSTAAKQDDIIIALGELATELRAKADLSETQPVSLASIPLASGAATASLQSAATLVLDAILTAVAQRTRPADQQAIAWMSRMYTPVMLWTTAAGTVAAGAHAVSVANMGNANGTLLGAVLKPSEIIDFKPSNINATLAAIAYDATGTEFLITSLTIV